MGKKLPTYQVVSWISEPSTVLMRFPGVLPLQLLSPDKPNKRLLSTVSSWPSCEKKNVSQMHAVFWKTEWEVFHLPRSLVPLVRSLVPLVRSLGPLVRFALFLEIATA